VGVKHRVQGMQEMKHPKELQSHLVRNQWSTILWKK
jgi:hypothetical protein